MSRGGKATPMCWDAENKLQLLLRVLEQVPNLSFDAEHVSRTWEGDNKPTPRAVRERVAMLRKKALSGATTTAPATPVRRATNITTNPRPTPAKRAIDHVDTRAESDDDEAAAKSKITPAMNHTAFAKRLSKASLRPNKRAKKTSDGSSVESLHTTTDESDTNQNGTSITGPRKASRRSRTPVKYIQVDGGNDSEDPVEADGDDNDIDGDFDVIAHRSAEKGERVKKSWREEEI